MKIRNFVATLAGLLLFAVVEAQTPMQELRPVARELMLQKQMFDQEQHALFIPVHGTPGSLDEMLHDYAFYQLDRDELAQIQRTRPALLQIEIPGQEVLLDLHRTEVFSEGYRLRTDAGEVESGMDQLIFYRGIVAQDMHSIATLSIIGDKIYVMYSTSAGNYRLHEVNDLGYVFYADVALVQTQEYSCGVKDDQTFDMKDIDISQRSVVTGNCVEIYFECDLKCYQDNGNSVVNTEAWVATLFNEVATLYENEDIPVFISDILVWTTTDPYASLSSTSAMLNEFVDQVDENGYDGRLAHLLSTRGVGGGIAYIDVLCSTFVPCGVSGSLTTSVVPVPNYSWNVNVVTHELGHNFGSPHTHSCAWNGNNTQIDDCGSLAGQIQPCYNPNSPIIPEDGTIMSYCHLIGGVGINFSLGFGVQPGNLIRSEYQGASCNTGVCSPPTCTTISSPAPFASLVEVTSNISWAAVSSVSGYLVTMGTSPGSGNIVNNHDVGSATTYDPVASLPYNTNIYVKVTPYNSVGNATGCSSQFFTTEPNTAPACTQLNSPVNGASNVSTTADLYWTHSVGNQQGYRVTMGTTPGGGDILNLVDVGNVTSYDPGSLPSTTTIYVRITPYGASGNTNGCTITSFTTAQPAYCQSQGQSVADEWISSFSLGSFTNNSGAQVYSNFTSQTIHVALGGSYPVSITPGYGGTVYPEYFRVWIDVNNDGVFANPGERFFQTASISGTTSGTITIPSTALIGTTRMRVAMRYGSYSTPCQTYQFGEVEDYTIQVHCNLVTNTSASGTGSLPWVVGCVQPGETVSFASNLNGQTITLNTTPLTLNAPVTIAANPASNITVYGSTIQRVFDVLSGTVVTISGLNIIAGTASEGSAIQNNGSLTLDDVHLIKHPGVSNSKLLKNAGMLIIRGDCEIE